MDGPSPERRSRTSPGGTEPSGVAGSSSVPPAAHGCRGRPPPAPVGMAASGSGGVLAPDSVPDSVKETRRANTLLRGRSPSGLPVSRSRSAAGCTGGATTAGSSSSTSVIGPGCSRSSSTPIPRRRSRSPTAPGANTCCGSRGRVRHRPEGTENLELPTGRVEVLVKAIQVLNEGTHPAFSPVTTKR